MTIYEVRIGDEARNVAARTPGEAAMAAVREHGVEAFARVPHDGEGTRWDAVAEVVGHGPFGMGVVVLPGVKLDDGGSLSALLASSGSDAPPWERPIVGDSWPVAVRR